MQAGTLAFVFTAVPPPGRVSTAAMLAKAKAAPNPTVEALVAEFAKEERELGKIESLLQTLENDYPPPEKASKAKRALVADWKLAFAPDESSIAPFATGEASGPFAVLEEIYCRIGEGKLQICEVVRKIGPFGNTAVSLNSKWSFGLNEAGVLSWRPQWMIDSRGREVAVPVASAVTNTARVTHVSDDVLVLRFGNGASYSVFSRLDKGALFKALRDDYSVDPDLILGA